MKNTRKQGFSLMELIVTIAIMSVITSIAVSAFYKMGDYWGTIATRTELDRQAERVIRLIEQDVSSIISSGLAAPGVRGESAEAEGNTITTKGAQFADDSMTLALSLPTFLQNRTSGARVQYRVDRDGNNALMRASGSLDAVGDPPQPGTVVARGVLHFNVEYADATGAWSDQWTGTALPRAIRVNVTVTNPDPESLTADQVSRQAVFPVRVE